MSKTHCKVCLALIWSNVDEESYQDMAHWAPIEGGTLTVSIV